MKISFDFKCKKIDGSESLAFPRESFAEAIYTTPTKADGIASAALALKIYGHKEGSLEYDDKEIGLIRVHATSLGLSPFVISALFEVLDKKATK